MIDFCKKCKQHKELVKNEILNRICIDCAYGKVSKNEE